MSPVTIRDCQLSSILSLIFNSLSKIFLHFYKLNHFRFRCKYLNLKVSIIYLVSINQVSSIYQSESIYLNLVFPMYTRYMVYQKSAKLIISQFVKT